MLRRPRRARRRRGARRAGGAADGRRRSSRGPRTRAGRPLLVKVYGRDAYDSQLLAKLWRTLWYQGGGPRLRLEPGAGGRARGARDAARGARRACRRATVVTAGEASAGDALLVLRDARRELRADELDDALLARWWRRSRGSATRGSRTCGSSPRRSRSWTARRGSSTSTARRSRRRPDQLAHRPRAAARRRPPRSPDPSERSPRPAPRSARTGVAALLPYLQAGAFGVPLRQALKAAGVDVDELRAAAAEAVGAEEPELVRLRRVTWWTLVQIALLALAVWTVLAAIGGLDYGAAAREPRRRVVVVGRGRLRRRAAAAAHAGRLDARLGAGPASRSGRCT